MNPESSVTTMMASNKTKIAKRVIEVFEFFDEHKRHATVMDIVRRYGRPQSSTSELLASLVEMGFLYKDAHSRSYMPTPRAAILGSGAQPSLLRNGQLLAMMDRLAAETRRGVALMGMVGTHVQMFSWADGGRAPGRDLKAGASEPLSRSVAGLLLLATQGPELRSGLLRRLNAEAPADRKFNHLEMIERIRGFDSQGQAVGESGFVAGAEMCAILLPREASERPLALGMLYQSGDADADDLLARLRLAVARCTDGVPANDAVGAELAQ